MNSDSFRRLFLFINFAVIAVLAVLIITQIWFELWDSWDIVIKATGTYVVMIFAAVMFSKSEHIANAIFKKNNPS